MKAKRIINTLTGILAAGAIMVTSSGIPGVSNEPITEMRSVVSAAETAKFDFCEPCRNMKITSGYGYRKLNGQTEFHTGMDVVSTTSDLNLYSVGDGEVVMAEENSKVNESCWNRKSKQYGFCNYIAIKLNDGSLVIYGHLCPGTMLVKKGDKVTAGQPIACMGRTGSSTAVHTHIELRSAKYSSVKGGIYKFYGKKYTLNPMPTSKGGCVKFSKKPSPVNDTALTNNAKYRIRCESSKKVYLGSKGNKVTSKTNIELVGKNNALTFTAVYQPNVDAWILTLDKAKSMALNCFSSSPSNNSNACIYKYCKEDASQAIIPVKTGNSFFLKNAKNPGVVLDQNVSKTSSLKAGVNVSFRNYANDPTQKWVLEKI